MSSLGLSLGRSIGTCSGGGQTCSKASRRPRRSLVSQGNSSSRVFQHAFQESGARNAFHSQAKRSSHSPFQCSAIARHLDSPSCRAYLLPLARHRWVKSSRVTIRQKSIARCSPDASDSPPTMDPPVESVNSGDPRPISLGEHLVHDIAVVSTTEGVDGIGKTPEELAVEEIRKELEQALANEEVINDLRETLEAEAQAVAEKALAMREEALEREKAAEAALEGVDGLVAQELAADEAVQKAEAGVLLAQEAAKKAEEAVLKLVKAVRLSDAVGEEPIVTVAEVIREVVEEAALNQAESVDHKDPPEAAGTPTDASEGARVLDLAAVKAREAADSAKEKLQVQEEILAAARQHLAKLTVAKNLQQREANQLNLMALEAKEAAHQADEDVARAMDKAGHAVSEEMAAAQTVRELRAALEKAEKVAVEAAKAAAEAAQAALAAPAEEAEESEEAKAQRKKEKKEKKREAKLAAAAAAVALEASLAQAASTASAKVEDGSVAAEPAESATEAALPTLAIPNFEDEQPSSEDESDGVTAADADTNTAAKPLGEDEDKLKVPSAAKKSSRFFPASYFSTGEPTEEEGGSPVLTSIRRLLSSNGVKLVVILAVVFAGLLLAQSRLQHRLLPTPSELFGPLFKQLEKIPAFFGALISKLPKSQPHAEETQLYDVLWLLLASVVAVPIFQRLPGGSPVLGYLTGGALLGPHALSIIQNVHATQHIAEFGVVFLLFNIGLELSLERLQSMKKYVFGLGSAQVLLTAIVTGVVGSLFFGISGPAAIVIGNGLALSSTAVVLQVLADRGETQSRFGRASFSVLLFQDLAVVVLLILIPLLSPHSAGSSGGGFQAIGKALGIAAIKAIAAIAAIITGGRLLLRPVYRRMAEGKNADIFAATTLLVCLGTSVITAKAGLSMALGAFLAGLLLAETEFALQVESDIAPYRGLLLGLFFMTVGMSINPRLLIQRFPQILGSMALLLIGKTALVAGAGRLFGLSVISGIRAGLLLAPGGEFAFVAFGDAVAQGIMTAELSSMLFLVVGLTMAVTPWLAALGQIIAAKFETQDMKSLQPQEAEVDDLQGHILIAGFGRVGQMIAQLLSERLIPFVALDVRSERVAAGRAMDLPVYFGDAGSAQVLHSVGAHRAAAAIIALDTPGANYRSVWVLKKHYPNVRTYVRAHDVDHGLNLEKAGATAVVPETLEPALQLAAAVLKEAKVPDGEIAAAVNDFRERHLADLTEFARVSGSSLGYGYFQTMSAPKALGAVDVEGRARAEVDKGNGNMGAAAVAT